MAGEGLHFLGPDARHERVDEQSVVYPVGELAAEPLQQIVHGRHVLDGLVRPYHVFNLISGMNRIINLTQPSRS